MDGGGGVKTKLQCALDWAARGFKVFPLREGGKKPAFKDTDWTQIATTDAGQIRAMWGGREYNIGVLTNDMIVVDIDRKKGKDGLTSILDVLDDYDDLDTLTVQTPSGGLHAYYQGPNRHLSVGKLGTGLDIRSYHGYVVAPGSYLDVTVDASAGCSGEYRVVKDMPVRMVPQSILSRLDVPIERTLAAAVELDRPHVVAEAIRFLQTEARPAIEGQGGDLETLKTAMWIKDMGVSEELAHALLIEHYNGRCSPPWDSDELRDKVANAYRYGSRAPGGSSPEVGFAGVSIPAPERINQPEPEWFHDGDDFSLDQGWLYPGLIPDHGVVMFTGPSGGGKTFVLTELARSLHTGKPFFGVEPDDRGGTIFLFGGSEGEGFPLRLRALGEEEPMAIAARPVQNLGEAGALGQLYESIKAKMAQMHDRFGMPVRLLVLETWSACALVESEEDNAQVSQQLSNLATLARALGVVLVISHHPAKGGQGARGAGAFTNNASGHIEIIRMGKEAVRTIKVQKAKSAAERTLGSFSLVEVEVGRDSRGRPVNTMVVSTGQSAAPPRESPNHEDFNLALENTLAGLEQKGASVFVDDGAECAPADLVLDYFRELQKAGSSRKNAARSFERCLTTAVGFGVVEEILVDGVRHIRKREII